MRVFTPTGSAPNLPDGLRRRRPRSYIEWETLRRWGKLPPWEEESVGYVLRHAREKSELTQAQLAARLDVTQQAVAQAERWESNPTVAFVRRWAEALPADLLFEIRVDS